MGDYSIIVYWKKPIYEHGKVVGYEDMRTGTKASKYKESRYPGTYKVTRVGGGKVTPPRTEHGKVVEPARQEDKVLYEVSPEPVPKPKPRGITAFFLEHGKPGYEYHAQGSRRYLGMEKQEDLGFGTIIHKTEPKTIEQQAGFKAGLTPQKTLGARQQAQVETWKYQERLIQEEQEGIRRRMSGEEGIGGHLLEFGRFWYTGFTPENLMWHRQIGEAFFGKEESKGKRLLYTLLSKKSI